MADQGISAIDEFDKMRPEDRDALHEVMEQQIVSVGKGGFTTTLNARTSILAAANPPLGRYDPFKSVSENLGIFQAPLLTRFDLIVIMRDEINREKDGRVAAKIVSTIRNGTYEKLPPIAFDLFRKYIAYVRTLTPQISEEAGNLAQEVYQDMRQTFANEQNMIPSTPRWIEGLLRLAVARAKLLLRSTVTEDDVRRSYTLLKRVLDIAAKDPSTQKTDPWILYGKPASQRNVLEAAYATFKQVVGAVPSKEVEDKAFMAELVKTGMFNEDEAEKMLRTLYRSGQIYETKPHFYRRI